jgi:hypothetical protein
MSQGRQKNDHHGAHGTHGKKTEEGKKSAGVRRNQSGEDRRTPK